MFLYVSFYGLSSEKFYASYAVIFCGLLLVYLVYASVTRMRADILKTVMLVFLWMYTGVSLLPVETIIAKTNFSLNQHETWRDEIAWINERSSDVFETMSEFSAEDWVSFRVSLTPSARWLRLQYNTHAVVKGQVKLHLVIAGIAPQDFTKLVECIFGMRVFLHSYQDATRVP